MQESVALTEAVFYILLSVVEPMHGYGIMQKAAAMSGGRVRLAAGTLYGALSSLVGKGWIAPVGEEEGGRRKEYLLTPQGRGAARREMGRLRELLRSAQSVLGEEEA